MAAANRLKSLPARLDAGHAGVPSAHMDGLEKQWHRLRAANGKLLSVLSAVVGGSVHRDLSAGRAHDVRTLLVAGDTAPRPSLATVI